MIKLKNLGWKLDKDLEAQWDEVADRAKIEIERAVKAGNSWSPELEECCDLHIKIVKQQVRRNTWRFVGISIVVLFVAFALTMWVNHLLR